MIVCKSQATQPVSLWSGNGDAQGGRALGRVRGKQSASLTEWTMPAHTQDSHVTNSVLFGFLLFLKKRKEKGRRDGWSCYRIKISQPMLIPSLTPKERNKRTCQGTALKPNEGLTRPGAHRQKRYFLREQKGHGRGNLKGCSQCFTGNGPAGP